MRVRGRTLPVTNGEKDITVPARHGETAPMSVPPPEGLVGSLEQDHEEIKRRFADLESAGPDTRAELFWKLTDQLVRHEVAEEVVVYPALRQVPGGSELAEARTHEQAEAEQQLSRMEKLDPASEEFSSELANLKASILEHARLEETQAFPFLAGFASSEELVALAERYRTAKLAAPNHPHPRLPDTPPANRLLGPVAALYDRIRDAASSR